jgi:rod shape-determining protein MreC
VLALLVVLSLILISASFGGSGGGPLHTVQSGFLDVLSPVESVANKALTPVHDLFKWVGDVFHASSQRDKARKELAQVRAELVRLQAAVRQSKERAAIAALDNSAGLSADGPVNANLIAQQPGTQFISQIAIDAGTGAGVAKNDPVINGFGLIGTVTRVAANGSIVTLINDPQAGEAARDNTSSENGTIVPVVGNPSELQMKFVAHPSKVKVGDFIVTAGPAATQGASLFPPNVLIGQVASVDPTCNDGCITVTPAADLGAIDRVQVLTRVPGA